MSEFSGFGVVAREPVMKKAGKSSYCEIAVAINKPKSATLWLQVSIFGTAGKRAHEQAMKGHEIFVAGELILTEKGFFYVKADKIRLINASLQVATKSADLPERQKPEENESTADIKETRVSSEDLHKVF